MSMCISLKWCVYVQKSSLCLCPGMWMCLLEPVYLYINHTVYASVVYVHMWVKPLENYGLRYLCCNAYLPKDICCVCENLTVFYRSMCVSLDFICVVPKARVETRSLKIPWEEEYNLNLHHVIITHTHMHTLTLIHPFNHRLSAVLWTILTPYSSLKMYTLKNTGL